MTLRPTLRRCSRLFPQAVQVLCLYLIGYVGPSAAQVPTAQAPSDLQTSGTAYFIYTEPGAPTIEVLMAGEGARSGIYRIQEGTSLTELLVLSGGIPTSEETERQVVEAFVRVLRVTSGDGRTVVYEATTEQALREPQRHPDLQSGDLIELDVTYEELGEPFTLRDGIEIASRVASITLLILRFADAF